MTIITGGTPVLAADLIHGREREPVLHGASFAIAVGSALVLIPLALTVSLFTTAVTLAALVYAAAIAVLVTYSNFEMAIAQARGDVLRVSLTDIAMALFPLVATAIAAVIFQPTATMLVGAWAAGALVTATIQLTGALVAGQLVLRRAWGLAASITRRSFRLALANGTALLVSRIDVLVVAAVISASAAGVYSIPVALSASLLLLSRALLTATYHSIMTAPANEVGGRLGAALRHSVIVVFVGGSLSVPFVAIGAGFVFGAAYSEIWRPYAILVPASAFSCMIEVLRHFLVTRLERQREFLFTAVGMLILNGVLAVVGAAEFGLLGAAASTTITYACAALVLVAFCARWLSVSMLELALPRRSDLGAYWRVLRPLLARLRPTGTRAR
ncbi:MAG TPA: polysaccharide biosynthesis C-terminal domain-containing protein [Solirubrobacteraceae bacterium]|jgi:O-antigen/teichoic acid export membrane protein